MSWDNIVGTLAARAHPMLIKIAKATYLAGGRDMESPVEKIESFRRCTALKQNCKLIVQTVGVKQTVSGVVATGCVEGSR
jgi:hypothetical protein